MNNPLRDLARSPYWQNMYRTSKELKIKLFVNDSELSRLQIVFLSFLNLYDSIYTDIASDDSGLMNYERIKDDMIVDAYILGKRKNKKRDRLATKNNKSSIPLIRFVGKKEKRN